MDFVLSVRVSNFFFQKPKSTVISEDFILFLSRNSLRRKHVDLEFVVKTFYVLNCQNMASNVTAYMALKWTQFRPKNFYY